MNLEPLIEALMEGHRERALKETKSLLQQRVERSHIVVKGVEAAMERLEAKCTIEQFNLLEIMLSGRAVTAVMKELYPQEAPLRKTKGTVVLATLEGDVHDLGKNIFKMVITTSGYRVMDCGKDCPLEFLVEAVSRENPLAAGVSGLISNVVPAVRAVRSAFHERGLSNVRIMAGGAVLKQMSPEELCVDFVAQNSFDGLKYLDGITGERR